MTSNTTHRALPSLFGILLLLLSGISYAQQVIKGKIVQSETGKPLSGATVTVKGTDRSQSTDENGEFSISARREDLLEISYVGNTTVSVSANQAALIQLSNDAKNLNEVVVTALGIRKEKTG